MTGDRVRIDKWGLTPRLRSRKRRTLGVHPMIGRLSCAVASVAIAAPMLSATTPGMAQTAATGRTPEEVVVSWIKHLRAGARADPNRRFPNPSRAEFRQRVADAASQYGFTTVRVRFRRPRQDAPMVVVRTKDRAALAASVPAILGQLDPLVGKPGGPSYEGLLFEARGTNGRPFLITFTWWRGKGAGGGQWASAPAFLPFPHA